MDTGQNFDVLFCSFEFSSYLYMEFINYSYFTKMKKILLLAVYAMLFSCTPSEYTINGNAGADYEGKTVYLRKLDGSVLDSCVVADGVFAFNGQMEKQIVCNLTSGWMKTPVLLSNGADIKVDFTTIPAMAYDNGGMNDQLYAIIKELTDARVALINKEDSMRDANASPQTIDEATKADYDALYDIYRNGITDNKDNIIGAYVLGVSARVLYPSVQLLDSMISQVKYAKDMDNVMAVYNSMKAKEATQEGAMFTDFTGLSLDGKESKFSDYVAKGKYVLVDFWASWCGPCKGEIPNLKELHEKCGEKLVVLGINVYDDETRFKETLQEEGIQYPQIFIPKNNKDDAAKLYGVSGIPQIMLFSPEGRIIQRNLRGKKMVQFVEEQLKK